MDGRPGLQDVYGYQAEPTADYGWEPLSRGGYLLVSWSDPELLQLLQWWQGAAQPCEGDLWDRTRRLGCLRDRLQAHEDLYPPDPDEREILVGLERLQHWSAGEPHPGRARSALEGAVRNFHRGYTRIPLGGREAARAGYRQLARFHRLGLALSRASMEVARLD